MAATHRTRLLDSRLGLVEDLRAGAAPATARSAEGYSPDFQVCLPYLGAFTWHAGREDIVGESNQVLFITGGEPFGVTQVRRGYAELILTPHPGLLAELAGRTRRRLHEHPLFRRRCRRADFALQRLRAQALHRLRAGGSGLAAEELLVDLLRRSLNGDEHREVPGRPTRRLVARAREYLEANLSADVRLGDVARAVGASPAYLTDAFRRVEGVPLYRYLVQLRLARALVDLPHTADLTTLALRLGFCSHSHFTAAFGRAFGCTPSAFRESCVRPLRA